MLRLLRTLIIYAIIYSLGFLSGMKYHGQEDKAAALQEDITNKVNYVRQKSREVINKVSE